MTKDDQVRIEIGYEGGHVSASMVSAASADELDTRLDENTGGVVLLEADDATITVVLGRVAYVRRFARDSQVGFGG
jgi:hypothetical protein